MRIKKGAEITFPLQSCLIISGDNVRQRVHNIIVAEEGSSARILTGCALHPKVEGGEHLGLSEFFVRKNATLNFTMIHNWAHDSMVRPRSAANVEENAAFISNYICLNPVRDIQMYPMAYLKGRGAAARLNSILYASKGSHMDVGGGIVLEEPGAKGEIISRAIAAGNSQITARGIIKGVAEDIKAHLECRGLLLDDDAVIHAIPELYGGKKEVDLSHEAAVGKIADKEITYLMSRGLNEEEATSAIVRGFLDVDMMGLPDELHGEVSSLIENMTEGM